MKSKIHEPSLMIFFASVDFFGNVANKESENLSLFIKYSEDKNLFILSNLSAGS